MGGGADDPAYERRFGGLRFDAPTEGTGRAVDEARAEAAEHFAPYVWYPQRAGRVDLLIERARAQGLSNDPVVRQEIARVLTLQQRQQLDRASGPGRIGSLDASPVPRARSASSR